MPLTRCLALLAAFGTLANSLRSNSASVLIRTLLRCSARPNGGGIPLGSSASRTSPRLLVRFAHFADCRVSSLLTPPRHSGLDPEPAQQLLPVLCPLHLMAHGHGHGTPCPYDLTPTTSLLTPHSSLLTPTTSLLTPTTSLLTPGPAAFLRPRLPKKSSSLHTTML